MTRLSFSKIVLCGILTAVAATAQYKAESAGAPPSGVPAAIGSALQKDGTKVTGPSGTVCEIWLVNTAPKAAPSGEQNVTLPEIPHGALLGVIRFTSTGKDRRGQAIKPGIYTMRYSMFPISGDHQGVAPQRDFVVLQSASGDTDPKATPDFKTLMAASEAALGIKHPGVMSIWKADDMTQNLVQQGESDWVLQRKIGDLNLAIVVVGTASA
jgi:hypothetical protein